MFENMENVDFFGFLGIDRGMARMLTDFRGTPR